MEAYCMKCKTKREVRDAQATFNKSGAPVTRGICPVCGTSVFRTGRTEEHAGLKAPVVEKPEPPRVGKLVIVESPAKARKIGGYLGDEYIVEASIGHIRDLPQRAADIPKEYKKFPWSREGVDIENEFAPLYVINPDKKQKVQELKDLLKEADELILATDEDREGEAIAWHLMEILRPKVPVRRMVFNEITKDAILKAVNETRDIDQHLVDAQETRRVLDRLFGYRLSPVLWKKVMPRISAGRVQSVATRLIVERERERMAFIASTCWDLTAITDQNFTARDIARKAINQ